MALVDLKTNLKSLRFGNDRPGGGSSNQPYITKNIPDGIGSNSGIDFIVRGGILKAVDAAVEDGSRLTQLLFDTKSPNGFQFIAKQNLLSRTSVKTQATKGIGYGGGLVNQGIYTPLSTIAQATAGFTGTHLNLFGIDPSGNTALSITKYEDLTQNALGEGAVETVQNVFGGLIGNVVETIADTSIKSTKNNRLFNLAKDIIEGNHSEVNVLEYGGGPGSILGIGTTKIKFADQRALIKDNNTNGNSTPYNNFLTWTQNDIFSASLNTTNEVSDFREKLEVEGTKKQIISAAPNYQTKNIENRLNLGNPGDNTRDRFNYSLSTEALDKINASGIYSAEGPDHSSDKNDLVKFSIGIVDNDKVGYSNYMNFRAYVNSFTDNYSAQWNETQYVGRGDKFYNYSGFTREISMGFTVFAQSKAELIPMYRKLNFLASSLAPSYSTSGFMRGNLSRLTLGGYLYNQLGILKSVNYEIPNESPWEIGINEEGGFDNSVKELSHMIRVSLSFTPIQEFVPRIADPSNQKETRYIALTKTLGNEDSNYEDQDTPITN